jgi:hypothetical protein
MGWLCNKVAEAGGIAVADFVCPTPETREAFGDAFIVWVDRIEEGRFSDTNKLFVPPTRFDVRISAKETPEASLVRVYSTWITSRPQDATPPNRMAFRSAGVVPVTRESNPRTLIRPSALRRVR